MEWKVSLLDKIIFTFPKQMSKMIHLYVLLLIIYNIMKTAEVCLLKFQNTLQLFSVI